MGTLRRKPRKSKSLSHLKENPQILKGRKKKKKSGRILRLTGRTGAAGASVSDLKFDLHKIFSWHLCSDVSVHTLDVRT